jgi:hypothetical protein
MSEMSEISELLHSFRDTLSLEVSEITSPSEITDILSRFLISLSLEVSEMSEMSELIRSFQISLSTTILNNEEPVIIQQPQNRIIINNSISTKTKSKALTHKKFNSIPDESCPICLNDNLINGDMMISDCNHSFCVPCIERWFITNINNECPCCRNNIKLYTTFRKRKNYVKQAKVVII